VKIYLCGPINGCTDGEAKDWRENAKSRYPQHTYIDPMRNDYRGRENEPGIDALIVEGDKQDIIDSDVLLVNYDKPSVGTSMEVLFAWEIGRGVIVVAKPGTTISPWLKYHASAIVPSFAEAFAKIEELQKEVNAACEMNVMFRFDAIDELFDAMDASWKRIFGKSRKFDE
jgi:hypothetical protein